MTCIVGLAHKGKVYMGGDSMAATGWNRARVAHPKVFCVGEFLMGYTTSFRMGQVLQYGLSVPLQKDDSKTDHAFMVAVFAEQVRNALKNAGFTKVENNQEEAGHFLVGYRGRLYHISGEFSVLEYRDPYAAVGCGADFALAAMHNLGDLPPKARIERALRTAAHFSNGVVGPFYVEVLE